MLLNEFNFPSEAIKSSIQQTSSQPYRLTLLWYDFKFFKECTMLYYYDKACNLRQCIHMYSGWVQNIYWFIITVEGISSSAFT